MMNRRQAVCCRLNCLLSTSPPPASRTSKFNAIYSPDVGHWDVPDLTDALAQAYELVEDGVLTEADFKAYVFENPYKLYTKANPEFFNGTAVEAKLKSLSLKAA